MADPSYAKHRAFQDPDVLPMSDARRQYLHSLWVRDCQVMEGGKGVRNQLAALRVGGYALFPITRREEVATCITSIEAIPNIGMAFKVKKAGAGIRVERIA